MYRKKSRLTQNDLASILDLGDYSNVSRWEHGQRQPSIETLLTYHLLFDLPIELLFERQKLELAESVIARSRSLLEKLQAELAGDKLPQRMGFLSAAIARLSALRYG